MALHLEEGPRSRSIPNGGIRSRMSLQVEAEGSGEALPRQWVIDTTQEILARIHALCLQTMYEMGSVRELIRL